MKKLIKIQSLINEIERLYNTTYVSRFDYKNENEMIVECYCTDYAIRLYMIFEGTAGVSVFIKNDKLKFVNYTD